MFLSADTLHSILNKGAKSGARKKKSSIRLAGMVATQIAAGAKARDAANKLLTCRHDYNEVRKLVKVVSEDGLSRSLMHLANFDGNLSRILPATPATESLDLITVAPSDRRAKMFVTALEEVVLETEDEATADAVAEIAEDVGEAIDAADDVAEEFSDIIEDMEETLKENDVSEVVLTGISVSAISAEARAHTLKVLTGTIANLTAPDFDNMDEEKCSMIKSALAEIVADLTPFTGLVYRGNVVSVDASLVTDEYKPSEGTLSDKGYTAEVAGELLRQAQALVDAISNLGDKSDDIEEGIKTAIPAEERYRFKAESDGPESESDKPGQPVSESDKPDQAEPTTYTPVAPEGDTPTPEPEEPPTWPAPEPEPAAEPVSEPDQAPVAPDAEPAPADATPATEDTEAEVVADTIEGPVYDDARVMAANYATLVTSVLDASTIAVNELLKVSEALTEVAEPAPAVDDAE